MYQKQTKGIRRMLAAVLLAGGLAHGQTPPGEGEAPPDTQAQVEELRSQVYELNKLLRQLEVQLEADKKVASDKAKTQPAVALGADGLSITSADKAHQIRIGGRLAYDVAFFKQDRALERALGKEQDGTGFRYARLRLQGTSWENLNYVFEIDFAGQSGQDTPIFRDVYLQYNGIPYGVGDGASLRIGHFREPYSLEELTAVVHRTFVERSLGNVFVPGRNAGVQLSDAWLGEPKKERLTFTLGAFKETDDWPSSNDSDEDQGYQITSRLTGLPYYEDDGRKLIHVGLAYSRRNPDGAVLPYNARPETRLSQFRYVGVEGLPQRFRLSDARADNVNLYGVELAGVYGPLSLQGEYMRSEVETTFGGDRSFDGWYAQATYFLTGEHRSYRNTEGIFGKVTPNQNFGFTARDGWGAWELTTRYSTVDLNSGPIPGGEQRSYTLGLNWYLNPNARVTWNYIRNDVEHPLYSGDFDVFQTRFQLEF